MGGKWKNPWDELELVADPKAVRLVFYGDDGEDYRSEFYGVEEGESPVTVAREVCHRFGWFKNPPGKK